MAYDGPNPALTGHPTFGKVVNATEIKAITSDFRSGSHK